MKSQVTFRNCAQIWDSPFGVVGTGKLLFILHVSRAVGGLSCSAVPARAGDLARVLGSVCSNWNSEKQLPEVGEVKIFQMFLPGLTQGSQCS